MITCPPYRPPAPEPKDATILELAARAAKAVETYRDAMDQRKPFVDTMRAAGHLARATESLTTAIADAVAEGKNL